MPGWGPGSGGEKIARPSRTRPIGSRIPQLGLLRNRACGPLAVRPAGHNRAIGFVSCIENVPSLESLIACEFIRGCSLVFNWAQDIGVANSVPRQQERAFTCVYNRQDGKAAQDESLTERISDAMPSVPSVEQLKRPISDLVPDVVGALKDGAREAGGEGKESAP